MKLSDRDKKLCYGIGLSVLIMIFGILFLFNAMGIASFYPHYAAIKNILVKYIVVIATMACGIMLFSNVALRFENDKLRKNLTIGITTFAFVMTLPLTYVFIALSPFGAKYDLATVDAAFETAKSMGGNASEISANAADIIGLGGIGKVMGVHAIYQGFSWWFHETAFQWVVFAFLIILGIVFLFEPLIAGICVVKGKLLGLFCKDDNGKFKVVCIKELPVLKARRESAMYTDELYDKVA